MAALYALLAGQAAAQGFEGSRQVNTGLPATTVNALQRGEVLQFEWSDAEERLRGAIRPAKPEAGKPFHVDLEVGSFYGEAFRGPVTVSLRRATDALAEATPDVRTVSFADHGWSTGFQVDEPGAYELDVAFRTTRLKTIRVAVPVGEATLPRWLGWTVVGVAAVAAVLVGVSLTLRRPKVGPPPTTA